MGEGKTALDAKPGAALSINQLVEETGEDTSFELTAAPVDVQDWAILGAEDISPTRRGSPGRPSRSLSYPLVIMEGR